jgi:hypothetical protein
MQLDVDTKHNTHLVSDPHELKRAISTHPAIIYCGISTSAGGCWALIQVEDPHALKAHYEQLKNDFQQAGLVIDNKGGNPTDARYFSTDPRPYVNPYFETYQRKAKKQPPQATSYTRRQITPPKAGNTLEKDLSKAAREVEAKGVDITATYEAWFGIGAALANELGEAGREWFHVFSQFHPEYDQGQADRQYSYCMSRRYGYTKKSIFYHLEQAGVLIKDAEPPQKTTQPQQRGNPTEPPNDQTETPQQATVPPESEYMKLANGDLQPLTERAWAFEFERMAAKNPALRKLKRWTETRTAPFRDPEGVTGVR